MYSKRKKVKKMTIEEIEIIVTAKVEEALQKFKEIAPTIQKSVKQASSVL